MVKKIYLITILLFTFAVNAQVGIGTNTPNASAALDVTSTNSGMLTPRMTQAQKLAIASPATGLLIYQTDNASGFWFYNGVAWMPFSGGNSWNLLGNLGTNPTTNKLGTTDNQSLVLRANNIETSRILANGNVGIGTTTPNAKLHVVGNSVFNYSQNFTSVTTGNMTTATGSNPYSINNNTSCVAADNWRIVNTTSAYQCSGCTGNYALINYGSSSCNQNATMVIGIGTVNLNSISISFNYLYDDYDANDQFIVSLYNETTNSTVATLLSLTSDVDTTFNGTYAVTAGNNYSLRFQYTATYAAGASVDNVIVSGGNSVFTLQDGNQAANRVLISDANGNGTWANIASLGIADDDWRFESGSTTNDPIYRTGFVQIGNNKEPFQLLEVEEPNNLGQDTQFGFGNVEYFQDVQSEQSISHNVVPINNNSISLGSAGNRWYDVYALNGINNTSDARDKENIKNLEYGTKELMLLNPVSYQWKKEQFGNTVVPEKDKLHKIGFIAQELQKVLPETVQNYEWKEINTTYQKVKMPRLGVNYAEIIPVVVKTIQEQESKLSKIEAQQLEIQKILNELAN